MTTPHTTARPTTTTTRTTTTTTTVAPVVEEYDYHYYDFSNSVDTPHHTGHSINQQNQDHPSSSSSSGDYSYSDPGNSLDEDYSYTEYTEYQEEETDQGINTLTGCPGLLQNVANTKISEPNRTWSGAIYTNCCPEITFHIIHNVMIPLWYDMKCVFQEASATASQRVVQLSGSMGQLTRSVWTSVLRDARHCSSQTTMMENWWKIQQPEWSDPINSEAWVLSGVMSCGNFIKSEGSWRLWRLRI